MFAGHTREDGAIQPLLAHLQGVAERAQAFGEPFGAGKYCYQLGLSHDIGKYSKAAQRRLLANGPKVDHATAGGQEIGKLMGSCAAYPVLGHHGGLPNGGTRLDQGNEPTLAGRLKRQDLYDYSAYRGEVQLAAAPAPPLRLLGQKGFSVSFMIRMLYSCLVDADFLDTENFMRPNGPPRGGYETIPALLERLNQHIVKFDGRGGSLNQKRCEILATCLQKARGPKGLYTLTVPTGGGKTIASFSYALTHAKEHELRRIIYVIPYNSIIEQNAAVFAGIVGAENVLEHHMNVSYENEDELDSKKYLSTENWDAPIIVTTNVQFFESLFAARTSACRKLHNIANSVLVFDEAQMLPVPYLQACVRAVAELVHNYGCTALLCTATQPALAPLFPPEVQAAEICENHRELYAFFKRCEIESIGELTDEALAARLCALEQVLCIVNTRKQAQALYRLLPEEGRVHLSTLMYPVHRSRKLAEIRQRLKDGLPCRVVSTSLVEAGVDLDFPAVFRAKAGLDSVIQAAGRCNREGKHPARESRVFVFTPDAHYKMPATQRQPAAVMDMVARKHPDIGGPQAIHSYFTELYCLKGEGLDQKGIVSRLEQGYNSEGSFPFRDIAADFRLIETETVAVLIPREGEAAELAERLLQVGPNWKLLRKLGRYSVSIYPNHLKELYQLGMVEPIDEALYILRDEAAYDEETGLALTPSAGNAVIV